MNTIIKLFRRDFLAQFIIDLLNKERDIGIKGNRQQSPPTDKITQLNDTQPKREKERERRASSERWQCNGRLLFISVVVFYDGQI